MINLNFSKKKIIFFKEWSNKKFAAYNSLKKIIKICTLCASYNLLFELPVSIAQTVDSTSNKTLEEVIISESIPPGLTEQPVQNATIITKEEIKKLSIQSIQDILEIALNIDNRQRGANGIQADISLNGGTFDQVVILLNGVNITNPHTGHYNFNLPINPETIERIEILHGNEAGVYLSKGLTGVINIITKSGQNKNITISGMGGEYGLYNASITSEMKIKNSNNLVSILKSASDGYIANTDFTNQQFYYNGGYQLKTINIHYQAGYIKKEFGANQFYSARYPNQFDNNKSFLTSVGVSTGKKIKSGINLYRQEHLDHYILIRNNPGLYQNYHKSTIYGTTINSSVKLKPGDFNAGLDIRSENILSNNLGIETTEKEKIKGINDSLYHKKDARIITDGFLNYIITYGKFSLSNGLTLNSVSTSDRIHFYPSIYSGFKPNKELSIHAGIKKTYRLPTFTDLYYKGRTNIGNSSLVAEKAWTTEAGAKFSRNFVTSYLNIFLRNTIGAIDWIWQPDVNKWHTENLTHVNSMGFEITGKFDIPTIIKQDIFFQSFRIGYTYIQQEKNSKNFQSYYVLDNLKHYLSLQLNHRIYKNIGINWHCFYQERNGNYLKYDMLTKTETQTSYEPFWLVDTKIYWNTKKYSFFGEVKNLFNTSYVDIGNISQPGRWIMGGFKVNLDFNN